MKKILILIVLLGLLYPDRPLAQNSIKLYPYQMIPSHHPDYLRHHVKSPDASFFHDKIQFIALRDLSGDYKQKLDQWVDKDKLGDILWVSYPLVFQDNLKEVVAEIKKRNLYLFDLWGYIPGSGPGGYWTQFVIPDGVLDLFEKELGDRWLVWITVNRMAGMSVVLLRECIRWEQTANNNTLTSSVISRKWAISWGIKWQLLSP